PRSDPWRLSPALCGRRLLVGARAAEDVPHRVVPLVTGVLEDLFLLLVALQGHTDRPRLGEGRWVVDGHGVVDRVGADSREALDEAQGLPRPSEVGLVGEVRDLDDERV